MTRPSVRLIVALRETAVRLRRQDVTYRWASFAHCNCGHLAQTITGLEPAEIQELAMRREGEWGSQARDLERRFPQETGPVGGIRFASSEVEPFALG